MSALPGSPVPPCWRLAPGSPLPPLANADGGLLTGADAEMRAEPSAKGLSEYGRLALELNQVELAQRLLEEAEDPANADWRTISAHGTVLAKQGKYREAIPLYERALALAPNQASI